jgi:hypothetical protein
MEAIRRIVPASALLPLFDLPWKSKDMMVEMIIMPKDETIVEPRTSTAKSLKGSLKAYANPALVEKENSA